MAEAAEPKINQRVSKRGGARPGAGRKKGVPNKATADVRALAGQYAPSALKELARLATQAESEAARVSAIKEVLDRAYGKSPMAVEHSGPDGGPVKHMHDLSDELLAKIATGGR
jgi:hypothetical protein